MDGETHNLKTELLHTTLTDLDDKGNTNEGFDHQESLVLNQTRAKGTTLNRYGSVETNGVGHGENGSKTHGSTEKPPNISLFQLFRFADSFDLCLIIFGSLIAVVNGLSQPASFIVYGRVITGFIYYEQIPDNLTVANNSSLPFDVEDYIDVYGNTQIYALYYCLVAIVSMVAGSIQYVCWDISMQRQVLKIRKSLFSSIIHQDTAWLDEHGAGELGTSFTESMEQIEQGIGKEVATFVQWTASCLGSYILALVKGWKLALACITFAPLFIIVMSLLVNWLKNLSVIEDEAYAKAGSVATEVLAAIKTVMSFNGQEKEGKRYSRFLDTANRMGIKKGFAMGLGMGLIWFVMFVIVSTAFGYGVKLSLDGEPGFEEPGNVMLIYLAVIMGSMCLAQALPIIEVIAKARSAAMKVFAIIDNKPSIDSAASTGLRPKAIEGSIELRNVRFTYPSRKEVEVLKDVSIEIKAGQTVAIVGHSGCGKSTIIQLIERFYDVSSGQVLIDGTDVRELNVGWLRNQIGLVSQEPILFSTSIWENIHCGREDITERNIHDAARSANIHDFIESLPEGYHTLVGQRGTQLSGGQKQRVAIARALARDPRILLLDEATSALDNESEALVQQALENAQMGRTTIIVAHRLSTIQNADLIVCMDDGKVVETGTHSELMAKGGLYADLVRNQTKDNSGGGVIQELKRDFSGNKDGDMKDRKLQQYKEVPKSAMTHKSSTKKAHKEQIMDKEEEDAPNVSFERLMRMNSPEWRYILGGSFCAMGAGALFPALTFLLSEYLRVFLKPKDEQLDFSFIMTGIIMSIAVANTFLRVGQYVFLSLSGEILTSRLRKLTFMSFLKQDMTFFDDPKHEVSQLATRLSTDASLVQGATGSKLGYMMEAVACIISTFIMSFVSSWRMTLVVSLFLPLVVFTGILNGRLLFGFDKADTGLMDQAANICGETIDNVKLIASLTMEDTFKNKYFSTLKAIYRKTAKRSFFTSFLIGFSASIIYFGYGASIAYGSYLMQYRLISFYLVIRVLATLLFSGQHIGRMGVQSGNFSKATIAASRLFKFIDMRPGIDSSSENGEKQLYVQGNLAFENVGFNYPFRKDVQVLDKFAFEVKAGQTVALVGASGCGKSTTVALIERFYDPLAGKVLIDGVDISRLNVKWLRSQIGCVQQEPVLFDCSIAENIAYGANNREVQMDEVITAARSANIHSFIAALPKGYETRVGNKGTQLSGGQKQRIAIARAMISNPRILLLDEATSALDSQSEQVVQEALDVAQKGRTCIVIAHRLSTIQNADQIAIIHKGSIVEMGSHSELIAAKGIYYNFLNLQQSKETHQEH